MARSGADRAPFIDPGREIFDSFRADGKVELGIGVARDLQVDHRQVNIFLAAEQLTELGILCERVSQAPTSGSVRDRVRTPQSTRFEASPGLLRWFRASSRGRYESGKRGLATDFRASPRFETLYDRDGVAVFRLREP